MLLLNNIEIEVSLIGVLALQDKNKIDHLIKLILICNNINDDNDYRFLCDKNIFSSILICSI